MWSINAVMRVLDLFHRVMLGVFRFDCIIRHHHVMPGVCLDATFNQARFKIEEPTARMCFSVDDWMIVALRSMTETVVCRSLVHIVCKARVPKCPLRCCLQICL